MAHRHPKQAIATLVLCSQSDKSKGFHALALKNYSWGPTAEWDSWVLLKEGSASSPSKVPGAGFSYWARCQGANDEGSDEGSAGESPEETDEDEEEAGGEGAYHARKDDAGDGGRDGGGLGDSKASLGPAALQRLRALFEQWLAMDAESRRKLQRNQGSTHGAAVATTSASASKSKSKSKKRKHGKLGGVATRPRQQHAPAGAVMLRRTRQDRCVDGCICRSARECLNPCFPVPSLLSRHTLLSRPSGG